MMTGSAIHPKSYISIRPILIACGEATRYKTAGEREAGYGGTKGR